MKMDPSIINTIGDKLSEIGKFLFETIPGIAVLVGSCLIITFLIAVILEFRTKNKFQNHELDEDESPTKDEEDSDD